jgi:antirestriction protein ArdC
MTADTIYADVTARMVAALEADTVPWVKPWRTAGLPLSMSTARPYRGVNVFLLGLTAQAAGYASPWWGTYRQISELGGQVRKGEKSTMIVFWKRLRVSDRNASADESATKIIPMLKHFRVFNAAQADGLPARYFPAPGEAMPAESAEVILKGYLSRDGAPQFTHQGRDGAWYFPGTDTIKIPPLADFRSADHYYATAFHECTHSTGHKTRCNRPGIETFDHFGTDQYSREELVAQMGASMLGALAGTETGETFANSAAYVASWLRTLKADSKIAVSAAAQAQRACDHITGTTFDGEAA